MKIQLIETKRPKNKLMFMRSPVGKVLYEINPKQYPNFLKSGWILYDVKSDFPLIEDHCRNRLVREAFDSEETNFEW